MHPKKSSVRNVVALLLVAASTAAIAQQTIRIDGVSVTCQNSCVVTTNSDGSIDVEDSQGGWLRWNNFGTAIK